MVLVHVTAFKGHHKIPRQMGKKGICCGKVAYPNVPVYVVCPRDGERHSQTLYRNYLLPINSNMEQGKMDKPMAGARNTTSLTPAQPVDSAPADGGSLGMTPPSTVGSIPQGSPD